MKQNRILCVIGCVLFVGASAYQLFAGNKPEAMFAMLAAQNFLIVSILLKT